MIDVAFTRAELRRTDIAVVIDVLRATSTVTQAVAAGYRCVLCADSIERAITLRAPHRVLAGEQQCVMPAGFQLGNSPIEATRRYADQLILATTNGAPTIVAATRHAPTVLLASLLNLEAVLDALRDRDATCERDVQIVCSGTGDAAALEDVYVAGRLCARLKGHRTDAARVAQAVERSYRRPLDALAASANAGVLRAAGLADDIEYCARESELDVLPYVVATTTGVAIVVDKDTPSMNQSAAIDASDTVNAMIETEGHLSRVGLTAQPAPEPAT